MITVLSGLAAGSLHVLSGPDHLAALAPMAAADHGKATALGFRWGLGHGLGAAGLGILAILGRGLIHVEDWSAGAEAIVGIALVGLGLWSWHTTTQAAPVATAGVAHGPHTPRAAFAFGMLHGAAGTGHLLAVLPALALPTGHAAVYLAAYFLAAVASMTMFTAGLGRLSARGSAAQIRQLVLAASAAAVVIGVWWLTASVASAG